MLIRLVLRILFILTTTQTIVFANINNLLPSQPALVVKFQSFKHFNENLSNLILLMFPRSYNETMISIKSYFEEIFGVDITELSNLESIGISTSREFGFGFNRKGQPFIILPISTTNLDERIVRLQNILYKLAFTSFTFTRDYVIATGKDFEKSMVSRLPSDYNVYLSNPIFDVITPFKIPLEFSENYMVVKLKTISSNLISLELLQTPVMLQITNQSYRLDNISYAFQKDSISIVIDLKMRPIDVISNVRFFERTVDLGIYKILTNFEKEFEVNTIEAITNLVGPSTFFIYGYNNELNNKIMFVSSVIDQNLMVRTIDRMAREMARKRDVFKFSIFDKTFYRLPIKENHNLYVGVIFNRFIVSTDRDILIGFVRNIANDVKEFTEEHKGTINVVINSQPTLNNTVRINTSEVNPFIRQILPLVVQSKRVIISSQIVTNTVYSSINIEY